MKKLLLICLTACFLMNMSMAQTGIVSGRITDELGLPLPGASIMIEAIDKGIPTNDNGYFTLVEVPVGSHKATISFIGYKKVEQTITVTANETTVVNVKMEPGFGAGGEVIVLGDRLKGQAKALNQQRTNPNITNVVAADQIGRFPDANIGDALKRIPGITIQNDQGEARNIIVRGLAPQLNSVMLNGERVPSAEGDNRNIQLDLIPSDLIQTIQVNKAVLPDMDADAIGGSVNLITRSAPTGRRVSGTVASGYNFLSNQPIWTGSVIVSDRFADGKLGALFSASYNNHDFGSDNVEAVWFEGDNGEALIEEFDIREYRVQRIRRSFNLALDYEINKNNKIFLSGVYNWRDDWENRYRMRVSQIDDAFDDGDQILTGTNQWTLPARVEFQTKGGINSDRVDNRRLEDQRNRNVTLKGEHQFDKLKLTWSTSYARASEKRPNERYISYRESGQTVNLDLRDPGFPLALLANPADNFNIGLNEITEEFQDTYDEDFNSRIDFTLPASDNTILKFGTRLRTKNKVRTNSFFSYEPVDENAFGATLGSVPNRNFSDPDYLAGSQYRIGSFVTPEFLGGLDLRNSSLFDESDEIGEYLPGNYDADEDIFSVYAMADVQLNDKLSGIIGLRLESTSIDYTGFLLDVDNDTFTQETASQNYSNFMPGIHLNYNFSEYSVLRFAYTNTIARPNYFDLVPYAEFSPDDEELVRGNPNLEAATSTNFDLMYENYFQNIGIVSGGVFYKDVDNFIYEQVQEGFNDPQFGNDLEFTTFQNGGTAEIYGLELSLQRQIWKGLGIYLNYTYTQSNTTGIQGREADDLSLPGTAENMFNASLSYETDKLVLRASLNYTSDYIDELGGDAFEDRFYDKQTFLDINGSYAFKPNWRFFFEVNNITNQELRYYQGVRSRTMQREFYNARFNAGLKFDLFN
ncbi:TonB-dependent receptor [Roseivirga misakiensis]|uniref:TonB-dependent receptor n=1 Tax=Roseivirga misakiensis TaxID=1563681 RepID=A0A1E5T0W3_9BACT|nr:TonB-dependent receptor [Roseivirga misakiensis]OEK05023.1 TonB-dependent receptor [Roseivirga misakiensis]